MQVEGHEETSGQAHPREIEQGAEFRAYLFRGLMVQRRGAGILESTGRRKAMEILQWFLLHPGQPCSAEQFVDLLWPDSDFDKAMTNFHVSLHALRRMLEPKLNARQESFFIRRHANKVYSFETGGRWWTDVGDLELSYQRGHEFDLLGQHTSARFYYRRVATYAGQLDHLGLSSTPWVGTLRHRYELMCGHSLGRLLDLDTQAGEQEQLLDTAYALIKVDPYHERAVRAVVTSSMRRNDFDHAAGLVTAYCEGVQQDLGLRAAGDLVALRERLAVRTATRARHHQNVTDAARNHPHTKAS
jgi:DNA-binding SARP family transcriptional activator